MKIALIGATGFVGKAILEEMLDRGHEVTAISRHPERINAESSRLFKVMADVMMPVLLAEKLRGHDVVISAYNPGWSHPDLYNEYLKGAISIQDAVKEAAVRRLIVIGGAGSLYIAPGRQVVDTFGFPEEWKPGARAARDYLNILRKEHGLDWTFLSPAIEMHRGTSGIRRGFYRKAFDIPVMDENNRSMISVEDLAVAVADETEKRKHVRKRFTVAY